MRHPLLAVLTPVVLASAPLAAQSAPAATAPAETTPRDLPLGRAERARYVGRYTLRDSAGAAASPLRVYEERGALVGQMRANAPSRLLYQGRHVFRPADAPGFELVFTVAGPRATRVAMTGHGVTMRGERDADTAAAGAAGPADSSQAGPLYGALARMDSLLFDASYVRCDTALVNALLGDDVEFYHDQNGVHRGAEVRADFARLAQNCPRARGVRREVVPGTLRVYPIAGFGAVQTGVHRFVEHGAPGAVTARFVHVWQQDGGAWKATRILSLDHHPTAAP